MYVLLALAYVTNFLGSNSNNSSNLVYIQLLTLVYVYDEYIGKPDNQYRLDKKKIVTPLDTTQAAQPQAATINLSNEILPLSIN